jgi:Na+/melibiose symporter-like transporter
LDDWQLIGPLMHSWLDQGAGLLSRVSETAALPAILVPVVLAMFSKRIIIVVGCLTLSVIAFYFFVGPSNLAVTLTFVFYFGSLLVALSGIAAHRRAKTFQVELERLKKSVNSLLAADERRLLHQLKSPLEDRSSDAPTIPYPEIHLRER